MQVAQIDGLHIHYTDPRPAGRRPLVFSNSLGTDFRVWDRVLARLDGDIRPILYDKRGHGLSAEPPAPYTLDQHVADLDALLDHLGVARAVVCGLSVGGLIAQGLATSRPDRVSGLVLCDTAHRIGTDDLWNERIAAVRGGGIEVLADAILERWFSARFRRDRAPEVAAWRAMLTRTPAEGYAGTCATLRDADLTERTKTIAVPTACVVGSEDGATPPDLVQSMAALIDGASFHVIDGAGHLPCIEAPDAVTDIVHDLLKRTAGD